MDDFEAELKASFLEEAAQAISDVEHAFIELETDPSNVDVLDKIFRLAHNLKGSSKAVGFDLMGEFTHSLESFLLQLKEGRIQVSNEAVSLLLKCSDHISHMIVSLSEDFDADIDSQALISELTNFGAGTREEPVVDESENILQVVEDIQQATEIEPNHELLRELGIDEGGDETASVKEPVSIPEVISKKDLEDLMTPELKLAEEKKKAPEASKKATDESIRISLSRLETLVNYVGEMSILQSVIQEQASETSPVMQRSVSQMGKVMKEVQDLSMSLRMVPIKPVFQKMQRIVRDTSSTLNKRVKLGMVGEDTEVDKTVLEKIGDPLVHLIRNSVDHGIESAEERKEAGKDETGKVEIRALHQGGRLVIEVNDDGGGLDPVKLKEKGVSKGIIKPGDNLTDHECQNLIFYPGFSTKAEVTDISGRGVGMDVVKTNIEAMNGEISLDSTLGKGTSFKISLPLTLAIIDALVIRGGDDRFVIPLSHVIESVRPESKDIKFTTGVGELLLLRGENLPLFRLHRLLGLKSDHCEGNENLSVMILRTGSGNIAMVVDDIIGQYQVVIKRLGLEAEGFRGISATTILGDGKPALILEVPELVSQSAHFVQRNSGYGRMAV